MELIHRTCLPRGHERPPAAGRTRSVSGRSRGSGGGTRGPRAGGRLFIIVNTESVYATLTPGEFIYFLYAINSFISFFVSGVYYNHFGRNLVFCFLYKSKKYCKTLGLTFY